MTNFQFACYMLTVILIIGMLLASGIYLIVTEHYGWAWIPLVLAACVEVKYITNQNKTDKQEETETKC